MLELYFDGFSEEDISVLKDVIRPITYVRLMYSSLPICSGLPADVRTKHLLNYKSILKDMYFDRSDEVLSLMKKITALF